MLKATKGARDAIMTKNLINLFDGATPDPDREIAATLFEHTPVRVERIVSSGQTTDVYDQDEHEWLVVLEGEADLLLVDAGETFTLKRGDTLWLPAHCRHQVTRTSDACVWLCVFWTAESTSEASL